ncbi:methyltransferase domain-containing protein [Humisphaera borealis]|uniref:Methyltransferase domain-containing protein n=2 Tax=Humisphaera borealis TaxID=2807512 RepID=A0A7M2X3K0_9BACT|nr:methyltransferase domain-containing protein [Humisphaera borealis]
MIERRIRSLNVSGTLLDVGCGVGSFRPFAPDGISRYVGADVLHFEQFPDDAEFVKVDLDSGRVPLPDGFADVVVAAETIEHLENPRAFVRELTRLARPGGWVMITTPNQLSLLSKLTLLLRNEFSAFRAGSYPAHLTALLEVDLRRIAAECGLTDVSVDYSRSGRVVLTPWRYPNALSRLFPQACSDNFMISARTRSE